MRNNSRGCCRLRTHQASGREPRWRFLRLGRDRSWTGRGQDRNDGHVRWPGLQPLRRSVAARDHRAGIDDPRCRLAPLDGCDLRYGSRSCRPRCLHSRMLRSGGHSHQDQDRQTSESHNRHGAGQNLKLRHETLTRGAAALRSSARAGREASATPAVNRRVGLRDVEAVAVADRRHSINRRPFAAALACVAPLYGENLINSTVGRCSEVSGPLREARL